MKWYNFDFLFTFWRNTSKYLLHYILFLILALFPVTIRELLIVAIVIELTQFESLLWCWDKNVSFISWFRRCIDYTIGESAYDLVFDFLGIITIRYIFVRIF